jgi:hypothetical protein
VLSYACLLIASKVEETLFSLRTMTELLRGKTDGAEELAKLVRQKEMDILIGLHFEITVSHPVSQLDRIQSLLGGLSEELLTRSIEILFDTMVTSVALFEQPYLNAVAAGRQYVHRVCRLCMIVSQGFRLPIPP